MRTEDCESAGKKNMTGKKPSVGERTKPEKCPVSMGSTSNPEGAPVKDSITDGTSEKDPVTDGTLTGQDTNPEATEPVKDTPASGEGSHADEA